MDIEQRRLLIIGGAVVVTAGVAYYVYTRSKSVPAPVLIDDAPVHQDALPDVNPDEQFRLALTSAQVSGSPYKVTVNATLTHRGPARPVDLWLGLQPPGRSVDWFGHQQIPLTNDEVWVDYTVSIESKMPDYPGYWNVYLRLIEPSTNSVIAEKVFNQQLRIL
jgi:hypothetical protein